MTTRLHVTLGYSAASSLKKALATLGVAEEVLPLPDDYSMGPIDPGDPEQRAQWEYDAWNPEPIGASEEVATFWQRLAEWRGELVVWMSARAGLELCGLHELVWRLPDADLRLVDVATLDLAPRSPGYDEREAFSAMHDATIVAERLIERSVPIDAARRAALRTEWQRLRTENAPLRVLTEAGLVSVPIDFFDERIRAEITEEWQNCQRVIGGVAGTTYRGGLREFYSIEFFFSRLLLLIDDGELEGERDPDADGFWMMHKSRVRRRPS